MRIRSQLVVVFALVLGLITAGGIYSFTQSMQRQVDDASAKANAELVPVVVAAREIGVRAVLSNELLEVKQIARSARHPNALVRLDDANGKVTMLPISAGEQVLANKLAMEREQSGLAFVVQPGRRAVAIKTTEVIGTGGLVLPGDHVDVVAVFDKEKMGKDLALYILHDIEVLAVAQQIEGDLAEKGVADQAKTVVSQPGQNAAPQVQKVDPKAKPEAKTVTLAVAPEEAERLILAEEMGKIRLALRRANEKGAVDLPQATLGTIGSPLVNSSVQVTAVKISPTTAKAGDTLRVEITVRNTSNGPIRSQGPNPEFTYVQGQTFHSQNFASEEGKVRVGLNLDGQTAVPFPYRWGLGGDLPPGAMTTVVGFIKLTYDIKPTNFWAGVIQEPSKVVQDNVGMTLVSVAPTTVAVVSVDVANVRSGPSVDSSVIAKLNYGTEVPILAQQADWYRVKLTDGREGFVAAGWIVGTGSITPALPPQPPASQAQPQSGGNR